MKTALISLVRFYQKYISPLSMGRCRFYPTCSQYFIESVSRCGIFRGVISGLYRIIRCNPFSSGGYDPVIKS